MFQKMIDVENCFMGIDTELRDEYRKLSDLIDSSRRRMGLPPLGGPGGPDDEPGDGPGGPGMSGVSPPEEFFGPQECKKTDICKQDDEGMWTCNIPLSSSGRGNGVLHTSQERYENFVGEYGPNNFCQGYLIEFEDKDVKCINNVCKYNDEFEESRKYNMYDDFCEDNNECKVLLKCAMDNITLEYDRNIVTEKCGEKSTQYYTCAERVTVQQYTDMSTCMKELYGETITKETESLVKEVPKNINEPLGIFESQITENSKIEENVPKSGKNEILEFVEQAIETNEEMENDLISKNESLSFGKIQKEVAEVLRPRPACIGFWTFDEDQCKHLCGTEKEKVFKFYNISNMFECDFKNHEIQNNTIKETTCAKEGFVKPDCSPCTGEWSQPILFEGQDNTCNHSCGAKQYVEILNVTPGNTGSCELENGKVRIKDCEEEKPQCSPCIGEFQIEGQPSEEYTCGNACGSNQKTETFIVLDPGTDGSYPNKCKLQSSDTTFYEAGQTRVTDKCNKTPCIDCAGSWTFDEEQCNYSCEDGTVRSIVQKWNVTNSDICHQKESDIPQGQTRETTCAEQGIEKETCRNCVWEWQANQECDAPCGSQDITKTFKILQEPNNGTVCRDESGTERSNDEVVTFACEVEEECRQCSGQWVEEFKRPISELCNYTCEDESGPRQYTEIYNRLDEGNTGECTLPDDGARREQFCPRKDACVDCEGVWKIQTESGNVLPEMFECPNTCGPLSLTEEYEITTLSYNRNGTTRINNTLCQKAACPPPKPQLSPLDAFVQETVDQKYDALKGFCNLLDYDDNTCKKFLKRSGKKCSKDCFVNFGEAECTQFVEELDMSCKVFSAFFEPTKLNPSKLKEIKQSASFKDISVNIVGESFGITEVVEETKDVPERIKLEEKKKICATKITMDEMDCIFHSSIQPAIWDKDSNLCINRSIETEGACEFADFMWGSEEEVKQSHSTNLRTELRCIISPSDIERLGLGDNASENCNALNNYGHKTMYDAERGGCIFVKKLSAEDCAIQEEFFDEFDISTTWLK